MVASMADIVVRTAVGYTTDGDVADVIVEALADAGHEAVVVTLGASYWQVFVLADLDEVSHAEASGLVAGVAWTMKHVVADLV